METNSRRPLTLMAPVCALMFLCGLGLLADDSSSSSSSSLFEAAAQCRIKTAREVPLVDRQLNFDREKFKGSAQSIARADLLACRNLGAKPQIGGDVDPEALAKALNGVWINVDNRTVHGKMVETDAVFYIQMDGLKGVGMLLDRNNTGERNLVRPYLDLAQRKVAQPLAWTFVNCTLDFVDRYVKVADQLDPVKLARGTGLKGLKTTAKKTDLQAVWKQLVSSGYFNSLRVSVPTATGVTRQTISARLGDGKRSATIDDGRIVTEGDIESGRAPGAEYELPMMTGGLFQINIAPSPTVQGQQKRAVMNWLAEYRGVGIGLAVGEAVPGFEEGECLMEGDAFVFPTGSAQWTTSDCGDKNGLATPSLTFERVVIGSP